MELAGVSIAMVARSRNACKLLAVFSPKACLLFRPYESDIGALDTDFLNHRLLYTFIRYYIHSLNLIPVVIPASFL